MVACTGLLDGPHRCRSGRRAPDACADFRPQRSTCFCDTPYRSHEAPSLANERTCARSMCHTDEASCKVRILSSQTGTAWRLPRVSPAMLQRSFSMYHGSMYQASMLQRTQVHERRSLARPKQRRARTWELGLCKRTENVELWQTISKGGHRADGAKGLLGNCRGLGAGCELLADIPARSTRTK